LSSGQTKLPELKKFKKELLRRIFRSERSGITDNRDSRITVNRDIYLIEEYI
jgi:hypothetical protein